MQEALNKLSGESDNAAYKKDYALEWKTVKGTNTSVVAVLGTLQAFDPRVKTESSEKLTVVQRFGYSPPPGEVEVGFDVIWCQWCLGHMSDEDLIAFLKRSKESLRTLSEGKGEMDGLIVVKENVCKELEPGVPRVDFDESDSSLTRLDEHIFIMNGIIPIPINCRSDTAWKNAFSNAGLRLVREEVQKGFPAGLYPVKM